MASPGTRFYEAFDLATSTTVPGVLFGVNAAIYFSCARLFFSQYRKAPSDIRRRLVFHFVYTSIIVLAVVLELGISGNLAQQAYVDHGGINGEPLEFQNEFSASTSSLNIAKFVPGFFVGNMIEAMQIWRIWVIWTGSIYAVAVIVVPILLVLVVAVFTIWYNVYGSQDQTDYTKLAAIGLSSIVLNLVLCVLITALLAGRLMTLRNRHVKILGSSAGSLGHYTSISTIFIESYSLWVIWMIGAIVAFGFSLLGSPAYLLFTVSGDQVQTIAYLLVSYRISSNRAWNPETARRLATIKWNQGSSGDDTLKDVSDKMSGRGISAVPNENETVAGSRTVVGSSV